MHEQNNVQAVLHRLQNSKALMLDFLCSLTFLSAFFQRTNYLKNSFTIVLIHNKGIFYLTSLLISIERLCVLHVQRTLERIHKNIWRFKKTLRSKGIHAQQKLWQTIDWLWNKNSFGLLYFVQNCLKKSVSNQIQYSS